MKHPIHSDVLDGIRVLRAHGRCAFLIWEGMGYVFTQGNACILPIGHDHDMHEEIILDADELKARQEGDAVRVRQ